MPSHTTGSATPPEVTEIIQALRATGEELPSELSERALALGNSVVPQLVALLEDPAEAEETSSSVDWAPIHAATLLTELKATEAIPGLVAAVANGDWDDILHNRAVVALPALGPAVLEPALAALAGDLSCPARLGLCDVLSKLGIRDERAYEQIRAAFIDEPMLTITFLASYGDSRLIDLVHERIAALHADEEAELFELELVELVRAHETLGGPLPDALAVKMNELFTRVALDDAERSPSIGLFEIPVPGQPSLHVWAWTCALPDCECRIAKVFVAPSREVLEAKLWSVEVAFRRAKSTDDFYAAVGRDTAAFELDIDSGEAAAPADSTGNEPLSEAAAAGAAVLEASGEWLDRLAQLWLRGKDLPDPATEPTPFEELWEWEPGCTLAWDAAFGTLRDDAYVVDGRTYSSVEHYCVAPGCDCREEHVLFHDFDQEGETEVAAVHVGPGDEVDFESSDRALAVKLWGRFTRRYPAYRAYLARRRQRMSEYGEGLHVHYLERHAPAPRKWVSTSRKKKRGKGR